MDLHDRLRPVRDEPGPVALHRVASSPVPRQVPDVAGRVDELEPPGGPEEHGPARGSAGDEALDGRSPADEETCAERVKSGMIIGEYGVRKVCEI